MYFLFINKTLRLNDLKNRTAMNAKISVFLICVETVIYLLLYNLHDCTFEEPHCKFIQFIHVNLSPLQDLYKIYQESQCEFINLFMWLYHICKIFKKHGLNITVGCKLRITYFLDVTFDLRTGKYYPYRKVSNELLYIHKQLNHPPSTIKQISAMISKSISNLSCDRVLW